MNYDAEAIIRMEAAALKRSAENRKANEALDRLRYALKHNKPIYGTNPEEKTACAEL